MRSRDCHFSVSEIDGVAGVWLKDSSGGHCLQCKISIKGTQSSAWKCRAGGRPHTDHYWPCQVLCYINIQTPPIAMDFLQPRWSPVKTVGANCFSVVEINDFLLPDWIKQWSQNPPVRTKQCTAGRRRLVAVIEIKFSVLCPHISPGLADLDWPSPPVPRIIHNNFNPTIALGRDQNGT